MFSSLTPFLPFPFSFFPISLFLPSLSFFTSSFPFQLSFRRSKHILHSEMMSTVFTNPLIQRENSSKTEPSQDPAQRPVGSQPTIDENDSKHDLLHHDNGHEQGEKEADTEHQKEAVEAILPLTTEDKPGVSIESFSEKEAQRQQKAATVIQSVCRGYQ